MQRQKPEQFEIFTSDDNLLASEMKRKSFLTCIWGHEKVVLMIIAFLTVGLVAFSLGFEKGKKSGSRVAGITNNAANAAGESVGAVQVAPLKQEAVTEVKEKKIELLPRVNVVEYSPGGRGLASDSQSHNKNSYTIQVASYKTLNSAEKEARQLKSRGFNPLVLSKGDFSVVCVGQFINKGQAAEKMQELRKRYQDCFVRRL
jgi:hypothetical protein